MGAINNSNVLITTLKNFPTKGGDVLQAMKISDPGFCGFGEAYFSWVFKDEIKAWKRHKRMTLNLVVPFGNVKFVFCLPKLKNIDFYVVNAGMNDLIRLTVPPGIWFGFQGLNDDKSLVLNIASITHDPDEVERKPADDFDFNWR